MPTLRVATYNIAAGQNPDPKAIQRLFTEENLDLISVQEVDRHTRRNPYNMPAAIAGTRYHAAFAPAIPVMGGVYGIALFSREPLLNVTNHHYTHFGEEKRVYQHGVYEIAGTPLSVYNTHLSFETPALRQLQVAELTAAMHADPIRRQVLFGDFNMDQSRQEWDCFDPALRRANGGASGWFDTFNGRDAGMQSFAIDNILVTPNIQLSQVRVPSRILSDHQLLAATLIF